MYAVCMYSERMQILLSRAQRRRLQDVARESGSSVAALVREAIDARYGGDGVTPEQRLEAFRRLTERQVELVPPDDLRELIDGRFDDEIARIEEQRSTRRA